MEILLIVAIIGLFFLWRKKSAADKANSDLSATLRQRDEQISGLERTRAELLSKLEGLAKYQGIVDADARAKDILGEAADTLAQAKLDAAKERQEANQAAKTKAEQAELRFAAAGAEADRIIATAKQRAEEIAGDAYAAMSRAKEFTDTAQAMKNIIDGYGDAYIVPTYSLLDDLAEDFGYTEAGKELKLARETSRSLVKAGRAATCEYVEANRKETAIRFVVDAFNGKVDSILSRSKADNHGKLEQEIRDAFSMVNYNGAAFRNARVSDEYLAARLNELKWAATANALKDQEREEQRQLREQMREEEKARKEYERAIKEAAKGKKPSRRRWRRYNSKLPSPVMRKKQSTRQNYATSKPNCKPPKKKINELYPWRSRLGPAMSM